MNHSTQEDDPAVIETAPTAAAENVSSFAAAASEASKLKDDPRFAKYFKMLAMHCPLPAVKQKMAAEGLDPAILDRDPEGPPPTPAAPAVAKAPQVSQHISLMLLLACRPPSYMCPLLFYLFSINPMYILQMHPTCGHRLLLCV